MRLFPLFFVVCSVYAETTLPQLIESGQQNEKVESYIQLSNAAKLAYRSTKRAYFPKIDGFGNATYADPTGGFEAQQTYTAGLKGEMTLFDGFKRENLLDQHKALEHAANHQLQGIKKEISLDIIQRYFNLQNTHDEINTLMLMRDQLEAQLVRLEKFKTVGLASEDSLMRMRSEVSDADYRIEDLRYQADRQTAELETMTNQRIKSLAPSEIAAPSNVRSEELDTLIAMRYSRDAKIYEAKQKDASYLPTLKLEDQYSYYDYRDDPMPQIRVNNQNKFIVSLNMNLFDFSSASTAKEALLAEAQAKSNEFAYASKEAENNFLLAKRYIDRSRTLIGASQKTFDAASKTFDAVKKKYESRIVDYVTYLDALHTLTDATNQLSQAKRTLHYAYAVYYYYAGMDPKEFVR